MSDNGDGEDFEIIEVETEGVDEDGNLVVDDLVALVDEDGNVLATDETIGIETPEGDMVITETVSVAGEDGELEVVEEDVTIIDVEDAE